MESSRWIQVHRRLCRRLRPRIRDLNQQICFTFYNFARMYKTLRCTHTMAAGISKTRWSMEDIVALIDARAEAPKARVAYKPRQAKPA